MLRAAAIALGIAYPFLVYAGLARFEPRTLALGLLGLVLLRLLVLGSQRRREHLGRVLVSPAVVAVVLGVTALSNEGRVFLFVPALVNAALLGSFGWTLYRGPSMIESFARLLVDDLDADEQRYAVRVTALWCIFFLLNGLVSVGFALRGTVAQWAVYNGLVSYVLIGVIFVVEFLYRTWRFRRYVAGPFNPILQRVFPPLDREGEDLPRA